MSEHDPANAVDRLVVFAESLITLGHQDIIRAAEANLEALIAVAHSRGCQNREAAADDQLRPVS